MNEIPDEVEDLRFAILDNSDPKNPDYFFIPLIFLESFNSPALVLRIGGNLVKMPVDWQILIGEPDFGDLEVIPLTSINDRGFSVFCFNPLDSFKPEFHPIEIVDIYQDVKWYFPKLRPGQMLAVPITDGNNPLCAYFVKDISRQSEVVDYGKIWQRMGNLKPGATYIYESPDGGLTTYAREANAPPESRVMIGQSWQARELVEQRMWTDIYPKRNLNPALTEAVEKCIIIYKLSEEYKDV